MELSNVRTRASSSSSELRAFRDESRRSVERGSTKSDEKSSESGDIVVDDDKVRIRFAAEFR